jgi:hypothetical protein
MKLCELIDDDHAYTDYEEWQEAVKKAYPQHASKMQFKGRVEHGVDTISAEVRGIQRCFGVWDNEANNQDGEGTVLGEGL